MFTKVPLAFICSKTKFWTLRSKRPLLLSRYKKSIQSKWAVNPAIVSEAIADHEGRGTEIEALMRIPSRAILMMMMTQRKS